jgi:hypothetical protein
VSILQPIHRLALEGLDYINSRKTCSECSNKTPLHDVRCPVKRLQTIFVDILELTENEVVDDAADILGPKEKV